MATEDVNVLIETCTYCIDLFDAGRSKFEILTDHEQGHRFAREAR